MKLNNLLVLVSLFTITGTTSVVAQTRSDTLRVKAGKFITTNFPAHDFWIFSMNNFFQLIIPQP